MTYAEQLKSPKWQKKRLEILSRDNFTCHNCGDTESQLHVHHGYYDKSLKLWEYQNETLHTVCFSCHSEMHSVLENLKDKIGELQLFGLYAFIDLIELIKSKDLPFNFTLGQLLREFNDIYNEQVCKYPY